MIMAILRIIGLSKLSFADFQITGTPPLIYSILEPAIGISVACIPLLQPLIKDTWLGKQLARSGNKPRRVHKASGSFKRLGGEENEARLFELNRVGVSNGVGSTSSH